MNDLPNVSFVGRSASRREDQRLLTGRGQFIADLKLPQMLHAVFVRSPGTAIKLGSFCNSRSAT
jgi:aerobic carbon-monoxide dehydrogenase large subunit